MTFALADAAQLALAAYSRLQLGPTDDQKTQLEAAGMASTQASNFAIRFPTVVTQYDDTKPGGMGTGFNATIFMDIAGHLSLAIRGTDALTGNDAGNNGVRSCIPTFSGLDR